MQLGGGAQQRGQVPDLMLRASHANQQLHGVEGQLRGSWAAASLSDLNPEGSAMGLHPSVEMQQGQWWAGYRIYLQGILPLPTPCPDSLPKGP